MVDANQDVKLTIILPVPRYTLEKCIDKPGHVTNFGGQAWLLQASTAQSMLVDSRQLQGDPIVVRL
jgi:hypothetical protein